MDQHWENIGKKRKKEEYNPEDEEEGDVDLTEEVEKQFDQVMNTFNEARRTGDPLRYDREVTQGICGFNKARDRCRALRNIDRNSVENMEEKVKKETRRFSTTAFQKLKEKKTQGDDRRGGSNTAQETS